MRTPKLFFDTNLTSKLNGLYHDDVDRIMSMIAGRFKIVASPTTFCELLDRLQGGDGSHFESDKEAFNVMIGGGTIEFLPMPYAFALGMLLGLDSPQTSLTRTHFEMAVNCLFHAKCREDLFGMRVQLPGNLLCGFDPRGIRQSHKEGRAQHREWLENIRDGRVKLLPPERWASAYATRWLGHPVSVEQSRRLADGLDAMYQYSKELCEIVMGSQPYNFEKHRGDWIDLQQLHYLCDPSIHLLTDDGALQSRVKNSSQGNRVLDFRGFLKKHGLTPRH